MSQALGSGTPGRAGAPAVLLELSQQSHQCGAAMGEGQRRRSTEQPWPEGQMERSGELSGTGRPGAENRSLPQGEGAASLPTGQAPPRPPAAEEPVPGLLSRLLLFPPRHLPRPFPAERGRSSFRRSAPGARGRRGVGTTGLHWSPASAVQTQDVVLVGPPPARPRHRAEQILMSPQRKGQPKREVALPPPAPNGHSSLSWKPSPQSRRGLEETGKPPLPQPR